MKALVSGIQRINGLSNKSGSLKEYDMGKLFVLVAIEAAHKSDEQSGTRYTKSGFGYESMEIDLDPACFEEFKNYKLPCAIDLVMDSRPMFGKLASVCVGITKAA
jgi:hypothetical protein